MLEASTRKNPDFDVSDIGKLSACIQLGDGREMTVHVQPEPEGDPQFAYSQAVLDLLLEIQSFIYSSGLIVGPSGKGVINESDDF